MVFSIDADTGMDRPTMNRHGDRAMKHGRCHARALLASKATDQQQTPD